MGEKWPLNFADKHLSCSQGSFTCRKSTTWDRRLYFTSEGRRTTDFITLKIHRPRPGLNPRTLGPVASTLTRVTRLRAGYRGSIPETGGIYHLHSVQASTLAHRASYTMGSGVLSSGVWQPGREAIIHHLMPWLRTRRAKRPLSPTDSNGVVLN
jgi:hypothetical protein